MKLPLYQGTQHATSRMPEQAIDPQHPMASLWQRSAAVAEQASVNIEQALIDRQEFTLQQNREAQLRQATDELNAELAQRLALADGAQGSLFDANGQLNTAAVAEMKKRYGRLSNTWTKGFINPHSVLAATEAQAKYHASLAQQIDSTILSSLKPRALGAYRRNAAAAVAAGDYDGAARIHRTAHDAGLTSDAEFYLNSAETNDAKITARLQRQLDVIAAGGDSSQLESFLYDPQYAEYRQRNQQIVNKIRNGINRASATSPSSAGGLRVVTPRATASYGAGARTEAPTEQPEDAPEEQEDDTQDTEDAEETPAEATSDEQSEDAPVATEETEPPATTEETETATTVSDDGLATDLAGEEEAGEEVVDQIAAYGSNTGKLTPTKKVKPKKDGKVVKDPPKPPVGADAFTRALYASHAADFTTPEAQRDATICFQKFLARQDIKYLEDPANLAYAQAYGVKTLHIPEDNVNALIKARKDQLSADIPSFDPKAFLNSSLSRWNNEYNTTAEVNRRNANFATAHVEDEADENEVRAHNASVAEFKAYNSSMQQQLVKIHEKTLTEYYFWLNSAGQKSSPIQQAAAMQRIYKKNLNSAKFTHLRGTGFTLSEQGNIANDAENEHLAPYTAAPRVAMEAGSERAARERDAAQRELKNAERYRAIIERTMDLDANNATKKRRTTLAAYASPAGAGYELPAELLTHDSDEANYARVYTDAKLATQAATVSFSTPAAPAIESTGWKDTNSKLIVYIPTDYDKNNPIYAQPNYLLPLNDGTCLNIEFRQHKDAKVATPSRALARRLRILGYQYNTITFDNNGITFLNRYTEQPAYPTLFATDPDGNPTGYETSGYHDAGAASTL